MSSTCSCARRRAASASAASARACSAARWAAASGLRTRCSTLDAAALYSPAPSRLCADGPGQVGNPLS